VHELADEAEPGVSTQLGPYAVGAQPVVTEREDALRLGAAQHVGDVRGAEPLADPVDAAERHLRVLRRVVALGRLKADVAIAAV